MARQPRIRPKVKAPSRCEGTDLPPCAFFDEGCTRPGVARVGREGPRYCRTHYYAVREGRRFPALDPH